VRSIYDGYLGWFNADPSTLNPLPPKERANSYVELAGGKEEMLLQLRKSVREDRNYRWAAEIATWLIRAYPDLKEAKDLKAEAFRELAYDTINASWRNFYLMGALELEGKLKDAKQTINFGSPDIVSQFRTADVLRGLTIKLNPKQAIDAHMTMAFIISDRNDESHALEIRRGIVEYKEKIPKDYDVSLVMKRKIVEEVLLGQTTLQQGVQSGEIIIQKGDGKQVEKFFSYFDLAPGSEGDSITLLDR
jgi:alkyl sulfatase BDS1-like metallo-beta-lactamase superfamily hydrolase